MRVFIDTNILISAALNPYGTPAAAYEKAVCYPNQGVICRQNIVELERIFILKFPSRLQSLSRFVQAIRNTLEIVEIPFLATDVETNIRDTADRKILRAAIAAEVDVLVTGDKDFLESGITTPAIMTAAEFVEMI